jgi:hypothetical protein
VLVSDGSLINRRELVLEEVRARAAVWCELDDGPKTAKAETDEDVPRATSVAIGRVKRILLIRFSLYSSGAVRWIPKNSQEK